MMLAALAIASAVLALALGWTTFEIVRLRRRERELISREALVEARKQLSAELSALEAAKIKQAFEEGIIEGLKQAAKAEKLDGEEFFRQGHEKGLLEGERNAEKHFRIETWTEIKKNQGYFFTSAEVVACYQLMYKNIPLGQPQRHVIEVSENVDRQALDKTFDRILGETALGPAASNLQGIRVIARDPAQPLALPSKKK